MDTVQCATKNVSRNNFQDHIQGGGDIMVISFLYNSTIHYQSHQSHALDPVLAANGLHCMYVL